MKYDRLYFTTGISDIDNATGNFINNGSCIVLFGNDVVGMLSFVKYNINWGSTSKDNKTSKFGTNSVILFGSGFDLKPNSFNSNIPIFIHIRFKSLPFKSLQFFKSDFKYDISVSNFNLLVSNFDLLITNMFDNFEDFSASLDSQIENFYRKHELLKRDFVKHESLKQDSVKHESLKQDSVKHESLKQDFVKHEINGENENYKKHICFLFYPAYEISLFSDAYAFFINFKNYMNRLKVKFPNFLFFSIFVLHENILKKEEQQAICCSSDILFKFKIQDDSYSITRRLRIRHIKNGNQPSDVIYYSIQNDKIVIEKTKRIY